MGALPTGCLSISQKWELFQQGVCRSVLSECSMKCLQIGQKRVLFLQGVYGSVRSDRALPAGWLRLVRWQKGGSFGCLIPYGSKCSTCDLHMVHRRTRVADLGFPGGGGTNPNGWGDNLLSIIWYNFGQNLSLLNLI